MANHTEASQKTAAQRRHRKTGTPRAQKEKKQNFAEEIRERIKVAREEHNKKLRTNQARLRKAEARMMNRSLSTRIAMLQKWLNEHGEDAMRIAADQHKCGIEIRGFGTQGEGQDIVLIQRVARVVRAFTRPRRLSASEPSMYVRLTMLDTRDSSVQDIGVLGGPGGYCVHICSHTPTYAGNCKNHKGYRIKRHLF